MKMRNELLNLFDDMSDDNIFSSMNIPDIMRTDIYEVEDKYMLEVELPGYEKKDVSAELKDGYLTITAKKNQKLEENTEKRQYIARERHIAGCKRSYYIGKNIQQENVHAALSGGILTIMIDKPQKEIEDNCKFIEIH